MRGLAPFNILLCYKQVIGHTSWIFSQLSANNLRLRPRPFYTTECIPFTIFAKYYSIRVKLNSSILTNKGVNAIACNSIAGVIGTPLTLTIILKFTGCIWAVQNILLSNRFIWAINPWQKKRCGRGCYPFVVDPRVDPYTDSWYRPNLYVTMYQCYCGLSIPFADKQLELFSGWYTHAHLHKCIPIY